jgi:hypothetical protein
MSDFSQVKISELLMAPPIDFQVDTDSLGVFFLELPKDVDAELVLGKKSSA